MRDKLTFRLLCRPIGYTSFQPFQWPTLPIYALSTDVTLQDDACNPLPESTPNLGGYLLIIRRGTCTLMQKLTNIAAKGAKYALVYNNGEVCGLMADRYTCFWAKFVCRLSSLLRPVLLFLR